MIARFDAECGLCVGDIDAGVTDVLYDSQYGWVHADTDECDEVEEDE